MQVVWYREVPGKAIYHLVRESTTWQVWCQNCFAGFSVHSPMIPGIWATAPEAEER